MFRLWEFGDGVWEGWLGCPFPLCLFPVFFGKDFSLGIPGLLLRAGVGGSAGIRLG